MCYFFAFDIMFWFLMTVIIVTCDRNIWQKRDWTQEIHMTTLCQKRIICIM